MFAPASAKSGALFVVDRSACVEIVVFTGEVLFDEFGSGVVEVTFAVLVSTVPVGVDGDTWTTSVNVAVVPEVSVAMLQVTVAPVVQVNVGPVVCVSKTKDVNGGRVSVQPTFAAFEGPPLVTVME